jgi:uncharacterized protein
VIRLLQPDLYLTSVHALPLEAMRAEGVRALLVDLDNTLLPRDSSVIPEDLKAWAARVAASGMRVCLVSNNWHQRVADAAEELGFSLVSKAVKPLPFGFLRALRIVGVTRGEAAVVGDQLFTDVLGGRMLGMRTVLVRPLSSADLPHTLLLRKLEARVLAGRSPLGTEPPALDARVVR